MSTSSNRNGNRKGSGVERYNSGSSQLVFFFLLAFRIANALSLRTFFQPDEYYQSLEPAWQLAFGPNSGAWLTWEWKQHLRSSLHPLLFACVYHIASVLSSICNASLVTRTALLLAVPPVVQAVFAAGLDFFTWTLAQRLYGSGSECAQIALALTVLNPWNWFCSTRTLSNCLETTLTSAALCYWPWQWTVRSGKDQRAIGPRLRTEDSEFIPAYRFGSVAQLRISYLLAAFACVLRPTNALIWIPIGILSIWHGSAEHRQPIVAEALICGTAVVLISIVSDFLYYGSLTLPPLNFLNFNLSQDLAVFYGRNRWDYYLTEGIPLLLTTYTPIAITAVYRVVSEPPDSRSTTAERAGPYRNASRALAVTIMFAIIAFSLISHKEVRFIYPLVPALHVLTAAQAQRFMRPLTSFKKVVLLLLLLVNIVIAFYASQVHQRGVIDVTHYIRQKHERRLEMDDLAKTSVGFLMPCHSTPWRSHFIYPGVDAWALTCEPPLDIPLDRRNSYLDEADQFYLDPSSWLESHMASPTDHSEEKLKRDWPEYVVFFEQLEPTIRNTLGSGEYMECWRGFNTHFHDDWRRQGDVIVWCRT